jgi:malate permease and related proteins
MVDSLFQAYTPLLTWIGLGILLFRFIPASFSTRVGRGLYWVGVPLQSFMFGRRTQLCEEVGLVPLIVVEASVLSIGLALISWWGWQKFNQQNAQVPQLAHLTALERSRKASFILAAMLGNTGFIGMTLAEVLIDPLYLNWAVLYNVSYTIAYSLAVFIASHFGRSGTRNPWWVPLRDVLTVPSQWAFLLGLLTQNVELPLIAQSGLEAMIWVVFASALLLLGLRLGSIKGWSSLNLALIPAALKVLVVPALVGLSATALGLTGEPRLVLVLMSGVPTGLATLILAEVYDLDRELLTSSITLTLVGLLLALPLWLAWFS